jgi:predicted nuclease with TOPRIM domain
MNELIELIGDRTKITHEEIYKQYSELKYNNTMLNDMVNDLTSKNDQYETNFKKLKGEYNNIIKKRKFIDISKEKSEEETDEDLCFICCDYDVSKRLNCCGEKICGICVCDISRQSNLCPYCRKQNMEDNVVELNNIIEI